MMPTGLCAVGKTVLLNEIERLAKADKYRTISIKAHDDKGLGPLIAPYLTPTPAGTFDGPEPYGFSGRARASAAAAQPLAATAMNWSLP